MCLSKCLTQWNFTVPELANPSDSAGQFLAAAFVVFVADVRGFRFHMYSLKLFLSVCLVLK